MKSEKRGMGMRGMGTKQKLFFLLAGVLIGAMTGILIGYLLAGSGTAGIPLVSAPVAVLPVFSPENGDAIVSFLESANESIDMEIYTFSSEDALNALLSAKERGVRVRVLMEERIAAETNQKTFDKLLAAGIEVRWASRGYALTHAKFAVVDGKLVLVGSHNLSRNALEKNREASVIISGDAGAVREFADVFGKDWELALAGDAG